MLKTKLIVVALSAAFALPAMAEDAEVTKHKEEVHAAPTAENTVTSNVGLVSDYIYRGITQTNHNPAIQGGFDYSHSSGAYAGVWASNISWVGDSGAVASGSTTMEFDTYAGFKGSIVEDVSYDVGGVFYKYVGKYAPAAPYVNADTAEAYGAVTYKWLTAKYSYGMLNRFLTVPNAKGTDYMDLTASYPIPDTGVTLVGHVGKQTFKGSFADAQDAAGTAISYTDYKLAVTKDVGGYVFGLNYSSTNASSFWTYNGEQWGKSAVSLSLTHSM